MWQNHESAHAWEQIAQQISQEQDPVKVAELLKKVNEAMLTEEREKVQHRLGITIDARQQAA